MLICLVVCSEGLQAEALLFVNVKQSVLGQGRPVLGLGDMFRCDDPSLAKAAFGCVAPIL